MPDGRLPFRGWVLLPRYEYDQLDPYSTSLQLEIGDSTKADNVAVLKNLSMVQARCVTRGLAEDRNALYLIELTDDRGVLANKWFQAPLSAAYNVRAPAYPEVFYTGTLNGGTTWTWATMLADIWTKIRTATSTDLLNAWPGLPTTPLSTPEGYWFTGVSAWHAFNDVLEHVGLQVACDLTSETPYTIIQPGATDSAFIAKQSQYASRLEDDHEWLDVGAGRVPGTVTVMFRRRNAYYGTEETVRRDSSQWTNIPHMSVIINAPATFSNAVGAHFLWDDFTVRYDVDGSPLGEDTITALEIAQDRVNQYFAAIYSQTLGNMTQVYAGALPFATGPHCDGVCWYYSQEGDGRFSWRTRIYRGEHPRFEGDRY